MPSQQSTGHCGVKGTAPRCARSPLAGCVRGARYRNGRLARGCGIVTVRQRPETAKGVIFITLEDETGNVNVIIWPKVLEQQRKEVLGASLLGILGVWQCEGEVRHLVAQHLIDMSYLLGELPSVSRNFH
ncbi:DNA polymerase III alpha subunit [Paraburkholderia sp. EB58]|jgi:error-prone DNA polymerase